MLLHFEHLSAGTKTVEVVIKDDGLGDILSHKKMGINKNTQNSILINVYLLFYLIILGLSALVSRVYGIQSTRGATEAPHESGFLNKTNTTRIPEM